MSNEESIRGLLDKGLTHYGMGEVRLAMETWQQVLALDPSNARALEYIQFVQESWDQNPDFPSANYRPDEGSDPGVTPPLVARAREEERLAAEAESAAAAEAEARAAEARAAEASAPEAPAPALAAPEAPAAESAFAEAPVAEAQTAEVSNGPGGEATDAAGAEQKPFEAPLKAPESGSGFWGDLYEFDRAQGDNPELAEEGGQKKEGTDPFDLRTDPAARRDTNASMPPLPSVVSEQKEQVPPMVEDGQSEPVSWASFGWSAEVGTSPELVSEPPPEGECVAAEDSCPPPDAARTVAKPSEQVQSSTLPIKPAQAEQEAESAPFGRPMTSELPPMPPLPTAQDAAAPPAADPIPTPAPQADPIPTPAVAAAPEVEPVRLNPIPPFATSVPPPDEAIESAAAYLDGLDEMEPDEFIGAKTPAPNSMPPLPDPITEPAPGPAPAPIPVPAPAPALAKVAPTPMRPAAIVSQAPIALDDDDGDSALDLVGGDEALPRFATGRTDVNALLSGAKDMLELDDFTGAIELLDKILEQDEGHAEALKLRADAEAELLKMYRSKIGDLGAVPEVRMGEGEIIWLNLDHRAGFVLSLIDGQMCFDDVLTICALPQLEAMRILVQLLQEKVIAAS